MLPHDQYVGSSITVDHASRLPEQAQLETWAQRALQAARRLGASDAEAQIYAGRALTVSVRMGEVESVQFQRDRELSLSVYFGRCTGAATTSDLSDAGIRRAAEAACTIARASGEDPYNGLPDAALLARQFPELDLCHPWSLQATQALELARACETAGLEMDRRITGSEGANLDSRHSRSVLVNSAGFCGWRESTEHSLGCNLIAAAADGMQQGYWYTSARAPGDLAPPEVVGRTAAARALAALGARTLSTRRVPVVFAAEVARGLLGHFCAAISSDALYRRASFLLDKLGETVFSPVVRISQRPFLRRAPASAAFDQEGVATRERVLVEDGRLTGYLLNSYAARRLGTVTTGNAGGIFNLVVEPTAGDQAELLAAMGRGLLVTELMGQGVNLVTGDYSRGAAGFWVEGGHIAQPVQEITVAGNLLRMFAGIEAIGNDVDTRGAIRCGSVLIDALTLSGGGSAG
ncbi:MAG: metalloprotease PmbA [Gammaproteobacteria bacterium]|nr:metalloprotease PmbA [Gammaproteobacteria bacterium]